MFDSSKTKQKTQIFQKKERKKKQKKNEALPLKTL